MQKTISSRADIDALLPGRFCVLAEVRRSGETLDVVEIERHAGHELHPAPFITARGRFNNRQGGYSLDGTDSFTHLLEYCIGEGASLILDMDYARQRNLRWSYEEDGRMLDQLDEED